MQEGVGGDVRDRDEEGEFDEEDARCGEEEDGVLEDAEVRTYIPSYVCRWDVFLPGFYTIARGQARADEEVRDAEEEEEDEGEDTCRPAETDEGEEPLQHEGEDNAADGAACCCEAGRCGSSTHEPVRDGADGGGEDEGGAEAGDDGEGEDEVP